MATTTQRAPDGVEAIKTSDEKTALSQEYDTPMGLAHTTMTVLKDRIKQHYDLASDYYLNLWGEHIHHGYYPTAESKANDTKEVAQVNLIKLLLDTSQLRSKAQTSQPLRILDVGCGIGGTSRYLAQNLGADVTGITISSKQVDIATRLTKSAAAKAKDGVNGAATTNGVHDATRTNGTSPVPSIESIAIGKGRVAFVELDAEKMGDYFSGQAQTFDVVWISEALSHFPNKQLFFQNAYSVLKPGGKLVLADWFKSDDVAKGDADIKAIEDGMLLPPLCSQQQYVKMAESAGLNVIGGPKDISQDVAKTWDITWSLIQNPSLWAFAFSQGRDGIAFLQSFRAMRRGYTNGSFRYAVMAFQI